MAKKIIYEGYIGKSTFKEVKKYWGGNGIGIACIPDLYRCKYSKRSWDEEDWPPEKVRITVEEI